MIEWQYRVGQQVIITRKGYDHCNEIKLILGKDEASGRYWILNEPKSLLWPGPGYEVSTILKDIPERYHNSTALFLAPEYIVSVYEKPKCNDCRILTDKMANGY